MAGSGSIRKPARRRRPPRNRAVDMTAVQTQVMLDRAGFSPGEIDGAMGTSTKRALDGLHQERRRRGRAAGRRGDDLQDHRTGCGRPVHAGHSRRHGGEIEAAGARLHERPRSAGRAFPRQPDAAEAAESGATFAAGEEIKVPNVADTVQPVGPPRGRQSDARRARRSGGDDRHRQEEHVRPHRHRRHRQAR